MGNKGIARGLGLSVLAALTLSACGSLPKIPFGTPKPEAHFEYQESASLSGYPDPSEVYLGYHGEMPSEPASTARSTVRIAEKAPSQCFAPEKQTGAPTFFHQGSIIDQPVLMSRKPVRVPSAPIASRNFFCAAFHYAIDEKGRVSDVFTLYNSHPGIEGVNFGKDAERTLKQWRYQPGMVDKAPAKYTGLTTVFYYAFDG